MKADRPKKPVTSAMKLILKEALVREQSKQAPFLISNSQCCKGLVSRGLMYFNSYKCSGNDLMAFHLTMEGRDLAQKYIMKTQSIGEVQPIEEVDYILNDIVENDKPAQ